MSAESGNVPLVQILLEAGADVNTTDYVRIQFFFLSDDQGDDTVQLEGVHNSSMRKDIFLYVSCSLCFLSASWYIIPALYIHSKDSLL